MDEMKKKILQAAGGFFLVLAIYYFWPESEMTIDTPVNKSVSDSKNSAENPAIKGFSEAVKDKTLKNPFSWQHERENEVMAESTTEKTPETLTKSESNKENIPKQTKPVRSAKSAKVQTGKAIAKSPRLQGIGSSGQDKVAFLADGEESVVAETGEKTRWGRLDYVGDNFVKINQAGEEIILYLP